VNLSQDVDDTALSLARNEDNLNKAMELFNKFLIISGLELNWNKSMAFWYSSLNFRPSGFGK
jgi:hypothetical protein